MEVPKQDYKQTIDQIDEDEKLLAVIKRHPFGIIKIYIQSAIGIAGAVALIALVLPGLTDMSDGSEFLTIIAFLVLIVSAVMIIILMIATIIYYQSSLTVTTKTITQKLQVSLFAKKTSQLSVTSIEDVTANKSGFFPTMFNFGKLLIETAGEQENFHFEYCPHPEHYARLILETKQQFINYNDDTGGMGIHQGPVAASARLSNYAGQSQNPQPAQPQPQSPPTTPQSYQQPSEQTLPGTQQNDSPPESFPQNYPPNQQ